MARLGNYLMTGLLVLAPTAITLWVFFKLLNWVDNLLGQFLRFAALDHRRIPGIGLVASWLGTRSLFRMWDGMLTRIPGLGILYGSTKSLGEALVKRKSESFRQVVLVQWPHPGMWRIGLLTGPASPYIRETLGEDIEVVFVPHSPNPASGFVHYVPKNQIHYLDWQVEDGLKVVVSGGVIQPEQPPRAEPVDASPAV